ncbi:Terminase [Gammaproteobacteria bacterium]
MLSPKEQKEFRDYVKRLFWVPLEGPQTLAYLSKADIIGYGGAAGGGKTDLIIGMAITSHKQVLVIRREKAQNEGIVQRVAKIIGSNRGFNGQKSAWNIPVRNCPLIEFGGLDRPGDERRWQGRPHDMIAFDEVTEMREDQVRFIMGWTRSEEEKRRQRVVMTFNPPTTVEGRWVIKFFAPWLDKKHPRPAVPGELRWFTTIGSNHDCEIPDARPFVLSGEERVYEFDPKDYPPEKIIKPKSRTFIPARVTDNSYYMKSGYISQLQSLPEPLRSQMLYGDFSAGITDSRWQVIPTAWVEAAQARWKRPDRLLPMDSMGVDVARGGKDLTVIARRHGMWFDVPLSYPGRDTPDGPGVLGYVMTALRDQAVIHIDVIGVGSSPYDFISQANQQVIGVNVSERALGVDKSGRLTFKNQRSELWWRMREALDPAHNSGVALPPDPRLLADLCAPTWKMEGASIQVASREDIVKKTGRSPDFGSAYILALMDTPKRGLFQQFGGGGQQRIDYDPYSYGHANQRRYG